MLQLPIQPLPSHIGCRVAHSDRPFQKHQPIPNSSQVPTTHQHCAGQCKGAECNGGDGRRHSVQRPVEMAHWSHENLSLRPHLAIFSWVTSGKFLNLSLVSSSVKW